MIEKSKYLKNAIKYVENITTITHKLKNIIDRN